MTTFKNWLRQVEEKFAAETATSAGTGGTSTADVAGNPYGAGIQHYNSTRDQFGMMKKCKEDKTGRCGLGNGFGGEVRPMRFSSGKTVHGGE